MGKIREQSRKLKKLRKKKRNREDFISEEEIFSPEDNETPKNDSLLLSDLMDGDDDDDDDNNNNVFNGGGISGKKNKKQKKESKVSNKEENQDNETIENGFEGENGQETSDEYRVKLAKKYLEQYTKIVKEEEEDGKEEGLITNDESWRKKLEIEDAISKKLRKESQILKQKAPRNVVSQFANQSYSSANVKILKGHHKSVTCIALSANNKTVYSGSKDCCVIKWDIETGKKTVWKGARGGKEGLKGHTQEILAIAVNTDETIVATAGRDRVIKLWNPKTDTLIDEIPRAHNDDITGLVFQKGTDQLFSCSLDRTVKVWDAKDATFVDALYGHEADVQSVDALFNDRAISAGNDTSCRCWKIEEESQLIFKGHTYSIDCVRMLTETAFFTGSQDGSIALWNTSKKKPLQYFKSAHGGDWISSVASLRFTNVTSSGSCDGYLKLWKCAITDKQIELLNQIPLNGFINGIEFSNEGHFLVVGIGQEHRLGRWKRIKEARNGIAIVNLRDKENEESSPNNRNENTSKIKQSTNDITISHETIEEI